MALQQEEIKNFKATGPLLCWDIFMIGYNHVSDSVNDIKQLNQLAYKMKWQHRLNFESQLLTLNKTIIVTDKAAKIVYASSNILTMTGYNHKELIGKKPDVLQGPATTAEARTIVRNAIDKHLPFETTIINYKKNGELYNCHIEGFPLFNHKNELVNYIAFENVA